MTRLVAAALSSADRISSESGASNFRHSIRTCVGAKPTAILKIRSRQLKSLRSTFIISTEKREYSSGSRDIGSLLGFRAEVEKKVADGAVVDAIWEVSVGNMGRITYVFEVQTCGSIDSLLLNLMKAKNNPSVQGIVAVSDAKQLEKIKKEASSLKGIRDELKFWDYNDVLKVFDALSNAYESINSLGTCSIWTFLT